MSIIIDNQHLTTGTMLENIFDPASGARLTGHVIRSGPREPQSSKLILSRFLLQVSDGYEPDRHLSGITRRVVEGTGTFEANLLPTPLASCIVRPLPQSGIRLTLEHHKEEVSTLAQVIRVRKELERHRGFLPNHVMQPTGRDTRYFVACGQPDHGRTGWMNGFSEVRHNGVLEPSPDYETPDCGCRVYNLDSFTVFQFARYPGYAFMNRHATAEQVRAYLGL